VTQTAAPEPKARVLESPYKGLTYYSEHDAPYFFGRESETEIIIANLMASRLTLLYGESGVGKSSVLHAGAVRRLHQNSRQNIKDWGRPEFAAVAFRNWQNDPIAGLREAVRASVTDLLPDVEPVAPMERLDDELFEWCERLDGDLVVVLDQFEEYFLYHPNEGGAGSFFTEFPRALNRPDLRVSFLIGIREDGLAKLDAFKGRIPNLFDNYLRIDHLTLKAARAAIEKPVERWNTEHPDEEDVSIEPELVDAVLEQVRAGQFFLGTGGAGTATPESKNGRGNVIETPFLQLVMTRLWEEEREAGSHALRRSTLERLGGAERIVRTHLDRVMGSLPDNQQDLAADIFRQLVTPSGTKIAHAVADLAEYAERPESDLVPVIDHLASSDVRVLRPVAPPPDQPGGLRYEIFHDVLAAAILDWRTRWRQAEIERELEESRQEQERERRRARVFRGVAALAVVGACVAALLGIWAWTQKDAAIRQRKTAHSEELAAKALLQPSSRLALALALAAEDSKATPEAADVLRQSLAQSRLRILLRGDTSWVNTVRWSPNGKYVLTASDDKTARIWDPSRPNKALRVFPHIEFVNSAAWSADGKRIVTASGNSARVWDVSDLGGGQPASHSAIGKPLVLPVGKPTKDCAKAGNCVSTALFGGAQSQYVMTASFDDKVRIWDSHTGKVLFDHTFDNLQHATIDPSGTRIVVTHGLSDLQSELYYWQDLSRKPVPINKPDKDGHHTQTDQANSVAFSDDGRYVITGSEDKTLAVWDAQTGENLERLFGAKQGLLGVDMSPTDKWVAGASEDGTVYLFDWKADNRILSMPGHTDIASDVDFGPDDKSLASASGDRTTAIWSLPPLQTLVHTQPVKWAVWSPNGRYAATATAECDDEPFICKTFLWNVANPNVEPKLLKVLKKHTDWVTGAAFSPDNTKLVTGGDDRTVRVWSIPDGKQLAVLNGHTDWLNSVAFSPNGKYVVSGSLDGTARIWDWQKKKTIKTIHGTDSVASASFDPSGRYIVTTGGTPHDYTVRVWDWQKDVKKPFKTLNGHTGAVTYANWNPRGNYIVSSSNDGTARVWDWRHETALAVLRGQPGALKDASFSGNGRYVVTTSTDGSTWIWDWRSATAVTQTAYQRDVVHSGAFSPDGTRVLTASDDWSADIFKCETCGAVEGLIGEARQRVARTVTPAELEQLLHATKTTQKKG
jgi:WD40 repeat protein